MLPFRVLQGPAVSSSCLQGPADGGRGPSRSQPAAVTFPTTGLRGVFVRERGKRRALLYKHNLAQVRPAPWPFRAQPPGLSGLPAYAAHPSIKSSTG